MARRTQRGDGHQDGAAHAGRQGASGRHAAPDSAHFTADFAATTLGMLFLEGGPPHFMGAHLGCFRPGRIRGFALEAQ